MTSLGRLTLACTVQARGLESFLTPLLAYDPDQRPSPAEALKHPWLAPRNPKKGGVPAPGQLFVDSESEEYDSELAEMMMGGGGFESRQGQQGRQAR